MPKIDLNADLGESFGPWKMGDDAAMMDIVTSANIACGGHAGDPATMFQALCLANEKGVVAGAHPGFADKEGFGRRRIPLSGAELEYLIASQVGAISGLAALAGIDIGYVKAHGALANWAAEDADVARAVTRSIKYAFPQLAILAISGTHLELEAKKIGLETYSEIFADRGYGDDGNLVSRSKPGAMIEDAKAAAQRLLQYFETGRMPTVSGNSVVLDAHSICIHGDSDHAVGMAREIKAELLRNGFSLQSFMTQ